MAGIDYGMGTTNIDLDTGIRYGVIHAGSVGQYWYDSAEGDYGSPTCGYCGADATELDSPVNVPINNWQLRWCEYQCSNTDCGKYLTSDDVWGESPIAWTYSDDAYDAHQGGDDTDIFITRSPYYTLCHFCSPCAPGAGYLESQTDDGIKSYCFGHEWFEEGIAPYVVYSVADRTLVVPKEPSTALGQWEACAALDLELHGEAE